MKGVFLMNNLVRVYCKNSDRWVDLKEGDSLLHLLSQLDDPHPFKYMCATLNNQLVGLEQRVYSSCDVEFLDISHPLGLRCYLHSLCFVLYKAVTEVIPNGRLRIEHAVSRGYYCHINRRERVTDECANRIKECMRAIIAEDAPFVHHELHTAEVMELFEHCGRNDKVALLQSSGELYASYYTLGDLPDDYCNVLTPSTGYLDVFDLHPYDNGLLLLPPVARLPIEAEVATPQAKMLQVFKEHVRFNHIVGLENIGDLNRVIAQGRVTKLIKVTEALQEKQIAHMADQIVDRQQQGGAKVVLIAGPSSSGKTTFSKRLSIQLMTNLVRPLAISLDNYFVDREDTPRDANGEYDFESIYALDLPLLNAQLSSLLAGEEVSVPTYNFALGKKEFRGDHLKLSPHTTLILEGIHALNPDLTPQIAEEQKFCIYVSALTSISIDDHNWIPTTDNRLLRRITRDYKYRNVSAESTILRWPSVRSGEDCWIFPYQENADAMFNSSLLFEMASLKQHVEPILQAVPRSSEAYVEAQRLLTFMAHFRPIDLGMIPRSSLLREFLGGSSFDYASR